MSSGPGSAPVGITGRLLTFRGEIGIEGRAVLARQAAGIMRGLILKSHGPPQRAVEPDGKTIVALFDYAALSKAVKGLEQQNGRAN